MARLIIGIDPGLSCGLASLHDTRFTVVEQGPADGILVILEVMLTDLELHEPGTDVELVIERFVNRPRRRPTTSQPDALEVIGRVEQVAQRHRVPLTRQEVGPAKRMHPNARLRELNLLVTPRQVSQADANDARDAVRHVLYRLATRHATDYQRLLDRITRLRDERRPTTR